MRTHQSRSDPEASRQSRGPPASTAKRLPTTNGEVLREVTASKHVDATPDVVWAVMTNLKGFAEAISGIESVESLDDGAGFGVGTEEWEP